MVFPQTDVSLQCGGNVGHHDHIIGDGIDCAPRGLGAVLHADDVTTGLLGLGTPKQTSHGGLREKGTALSTE